MPVNYQNLLTLSTTTLPKFVSRAGAKDGFGLINETIPRTLLAGMLLRRARKDWSGGITWSFDLQFNRAEVGEWVGVGQKLGLRGTRPLTRGSVPRRTYQWAWYKDYQELDPNKGTFEVVQDILEMAKEDAGVAIITALENAITSYDGNWAHDGAASGDFLLPFGWRFWITIDGLHITGNSGYTVGGINASTQPLWQNGYINPVAASDGMRPIRSVHDLRTGWTRALRMLRFDSVRDWGAVGKDIQNVNQYDPDTAETPRDLLILCDPRTSIDFREVVFGREDNVGRDQGRGRPVFKGIEVGDYDSMGMPSTGYGTFPSDGTATWPDRTTLGQAPYATGQWPNWGESCVLNTKFLHFLVDPRSFPQIKKPYEPEGLFGLAYEGKIVAQTACRSRRRGGVYVGPFELALAA